MTLVQWWCSGVVLNRIFTPSASSQQRPSTGRARENAASGQGDPGQNSQKPSPASIGRAFDRTA
jgi:hypothetical protein